MGDDFEWKERSFSGAFRCTEKKHAKNFIEKGEIKFSTPQSWVDWAIRNGEGRGDKLEGIVAMCSMFDAENFVALYRKYIKYYDFKCDISERRHWFRRGYTMRLPCYCLYALKHEMFECPGREGIHELKAEVPSTYFKDFAENKKRDEILKMPEDDRPVIVVIKDFDTFLLRLKKALKKYKVNDREVKFNFIEYENFNKYGKDGWLDLERKRPDELFVKSNKFSHQNEIRIVINSLNRHVVEFLTSNVITIGKMDDIATIIDYYFFEGMLVQMKAKVVKI